MPYSYTLERAYYSGCIKADVAKGRTSQQACNDVFKCHLLTGRFDPKQAMIETKAAAHFAGIEEGAVKW